MTGNSFNPQNVSSENMSNHLKRFFTSRTNPEVFILFTTVFEYDLELFINKTIEVINIEQDESSDSSPETVSKSEMLAMIKKLSKRIEELEKQNGQNHILRTEAVEEAYFYNENNYFDDNVCHNDAIPFSNSPVLYISSNNAQSTQCIIDNEAMNNINELQFDEPSDHRNNETISMADTTDIGSRTVITDISCLETITVATDISTSFYTFNTITDAKLKVIYSKLKATFKRKVFLLSEARTKLFNSKCKPSSEDFNNIINLLVTKNKLEKLTQEKPFKFRCRTH